MELIHWHRYPYLFLVIPFITGIIASPYLPDISPITFLVAFGLLFLVGKTCSGIAFCSITFILIFMTGIFCYRPAVPEFTAGKVYSLKGRCEQMLSPNRGVIFAHGLRVYLQSQDTFNGSTGDSIACTVRLYSLASTNNLHEFDYNKYLRHQNIHARGIATSDIVIQGHSEDFYSYCQSVQARLIQKLARVVDDTSTSRLLSVLCLGSRKNLDPDTKDLFQVTGTVHLLAISGLHMGAIYLLLLYGLRGCRVRNKKYELVLIPLIWFITCITGLSPSACRAATILSFATIGRVFQQDYIPLNAIAAAAFYSLLFAPNMLYSVSFQMSYAAYTGIMLIYPRIELKKRQAPAPIRWLYSLLCLSLSAQVLTLPITAYYFHTINLNSVLINILAVPIATYLLYTGVFLLVLPGVIGGYLAGIATGLANVLLLCLRTFHRIAINIPDFHPTITHILFIYCIMTLLFIYAATRKRMILSWICGITGIFLIFTCMYTFHQHAKEEIIIYNRYRQSTLVFNYNGFYTFLKNTDTTGFLPAYITANHLQPLSTHEGFVGEEVRYTPNRLITPRQTITILDPEHPDALDAEIVIVTDHVFPPVNTILRTFRLKQVILDSSNSYRCIKAWESFCNRHNIPLFKTSELGTITLPLNQDECLKTLSFF